MIFIKRIKLYGLRGLLTRLAKGLPGVNKWSKIILKSIFFIFKSSKKMYLKKEYRFSKKSKYLKN